MEFMNFVVKYGAEVALIAFASIFFVGLFKVLLNKPLSKIEKSNRKPLYETLSIVFAYGFTALWIWAKVALFNMPGDPFTWALLAEKGSLSYIAVKVMYPLYENYKLRDLVQLIGKGIVSIFKKKKEEPKEVEASESRPTNI